MERSAAGDARELTVDQEQAIRRAMQTFVEENAAFRASRSPVAWCDRCQTWRPSAGSIAYDDTVFCNLCATDYELARARGHVQTAAAFLTR